MQFLGFKEITNISDISRNYINKISSKRLYSSLPEGYFYVLEYGKNSDILFSIPYKKIVNRENIETIESSQIREYLELGKYFICSDIIYFDLDDCPRLYNVDEFEIPRTSMNCRISSVGTIENSGKQYFPSEIAYYITAISGVSKTSEASLKYLGNVGSSGYAKSCRSLTQALRSVGIDYIFEPTKITEAIPEDSHNMLRYSEYQDYDTIIIHEVPTDWIAKRIKDEKAKNKKVILITVWETLNFPDSWKAIFKLADIVALPSLWNIFPNAEYLPHPVIEYPITLSTESSYVFYTINEWTGRKHIEDIIEAYSREFSPSENVLLIIKTSSIKKEDIDKYLIKYSNLPPIEIILDKLSDKQIEDIHKRGCCYISLPGSEGMGYGLCEASMRGKPVICTSFGAQLEYVKGIYYVSTTLEKAKYCNKNSSLHESCREHCRINPFYNSGELWGRAVIKDVSRTMRYLFDKNIRLETTARDYLLYYYSCKSIGKQLSALLQK